MAAIAYVSGDENLISIAEDDSKDIHCETAKTAFGIQIPEGETTKSYIKANFNNLRTSSKVVLFGLAYGRGPRSLAKQLKVQGVEDADTNYAKRVIESIFNAYPKLHEYMERQRAAVYNPGYAENPFGMRRYFFDSSSKSVMSAQERASVNFPKLLEWGIKIG